MAKVLEASRTDIFSEAVLRQPADTEQQAPPCCPQEEKRVGLFERFSGLLKQAGEGLLRILLY